MLIGTAANFLEGGSVHTYADGMSDRMPAIKVVMMPKDTNAHGTIFGGVILSHVDLASGVEAFKVAPHLYVTKAMREVEFHEPVYTGDLVSFFPSVVRVGRTSVTIRVKTSRDSATGGLTSARLPWTPLLNRSPGCSPPLGAVEHLLRPALVWIPRA